MKKLLIFTFALLLCLMATSALAAETTYSGVCDPIVINQPGEHTVVLNGVTINATSGAAFSIQSSATKVTIILADGTTNTLSTSNGSSPGIANNGKDIVIRCAGEGESHECTDNCGKLIVNGGRYSAGIGSAEYREFSGSIIISGGTVTAKGGWYYGAGIGSGAGSIYNGSVTITGGTVNAIGGSSGGTGIGSSDREMKQNSSITITGGTVKVTEGIGTGDESPRMSGTITITGGTVTTDGTVGIGCSDGEMSGTIKITGGTVTAYGDRGAGIGSGKTMSGTIEITGGTVIASSGYSVGIGSGIADDFGGKIIVRGGDVTAIGDSSNHSKNPGIGAGYVGGEILSTAEIYVDPINGKIGVKQGKNEESAKNLEGTPYSALTDLIPLLDGSSYVRFRHIPAEYAIVTQTEAGGSVSANPEKGEEGTEVTLTATPGEGYRFVRWEVVSGGVTITDNKFTIGTSDVVVNGIFEKLTYPITWKNYDGTVLETDPAVPYGETPTYDGETPVKPDDAQYTYTFTGWSPAISPVTGEVTYTAQFSNSTNTYPITWKNYDGTVLETDPAVPYGETPTYDGETPVKPDDAQYTYTFTGWSPAISPVTGEVTYTAQFSNSTNTYPITWKNYDGTVLETDPAVPYGETPTYDGETPVKPDDAQYTYTFTGWSPAISPVTGEVTYTAQFSNGTNTYPITWKNYDGTVLETDPAVPYGETPFYDGKTPVKPDDAQYTYTFTGWSPAVSPITKEADYIAQFTATLNTYAITWKNYDGTVLEVDETVNYGIIPIYNGATPTRPADSKYTYTFKGWSPAVTIASADCEYIAVYEATVPDVPKTGDSMNFAFLALLAAAGMIGMTVIIRKKNEA